MILQPKRGVERPSAWRTLPVASLHLAKASEKYRIRFYYGGAEFKRSLTTGDEKEALSVKGRVEETIRLLERGRLELPAGADPARFILSDGKMTDKPVVQKALTLAGLFSVYDVGVPEGAKEANTRTTERLHCERLRRIVGGEPRSSR